MKKQHIKKAIRSMFILLLMICLLTGCKTSEKKLAEESKEPVKISIILTVDPSTGTKNEQKVVEAFNKKYKGTYELDVDWIVETEDDYRQNLKRLNATDELPDIITDLRMLPSFYQKMIAENRIADLTPYIDADEEKAALTQTEIFILHQFQLRLFPAAAYSGIRNCLTKPALIPFQQHGMSSGRVVTNLQTQVSRHWHYIQMERDGHLCYWQVQQSLLHRKKVLNL
mgnify:CR=1 FL=1